MLTTGSSSRWASKICCEMWLQYSFVLFCVTVLSMTTATDNRTLLLLIVIVPKVTTALLVVIASSSKKTGGITTI